MKNILVINSLKEKNKPLIGFFEALKKNNNLFFRGSDDYFLEKFKPEAKKNFFGPKVDDSAGFIFYFLLLGLYFWRFFSLLGVKVKNKIEIIICIGLNEKIIFTPLAKILGLKIIWLEIPNRKRNQKGLLRFFSRWAKIAVFTSAQMENLIASGFKKANIFNISLGLDLTANIKQENIFSPLAVADKPYQFFKNFSIGTIINFDDNFQLENLLRAVKNCCNVIPNIQLVIIGKIADRNNFNWLVRKIGLERRVWFVGEQENVAKWFENFDLYVVASSRPELADLEATILAMSRGVPTIAYYDPFLADFLLEGETGFFVSPINIDSMTQKIIAVEPDKRLLKKVGENGQILVNNYFFREKQIENFSKIINYK